MNNKIKELKKYINTSKKIVVFTGAGSSTESGIKDFRSKDGLYNIKYKYPPEQILSHTFFTNNQEEFYKFYKDKLNCLNKLPNTFHKYLTLLEKSHKLTTIITQNIDGLHQKAGSKNVIELHGTIYKNHCLNCHKNYTAEEVFNSKNTIPKCSCGGTIKPDVILYEEPLNQKALNNAIKYIKESDLLIIAGTSLTVYPASSLIKYFQGQHLVIINKEKTPQDNIANIVINDSLGNVVKELTNQN